MLDIIFSFSTEKIQKINPETGSTLKKRFLNCTEFPIMISIRNKMSFHSAVHHIKCAFGLESKDIYYKNTQSSSKYWRC